MPNPFENALTQLDGALSVQKFPEGFIKQLSSPYRQIRISIPVIRDDGSVEVYEGYRVEHNNARGPFKGGIRFHQNTDINEVKALAFWMSLKTALMGIPMGGGKGGVTVNPKELSEKEIEQIARGWVRGMADVLGPHKDVPAPDVNTNPQIMGWMTDEFKKISGDATGATFTGKALEDGGSEGRGVATGLGGFYAFDTLKDEYGIAPGARIVIQGFGNVGSTAAIFFEEAGYKVIGLSDSRGGIVNEDGFNIKEVQEWKKQNRSLDGFPGSRSVTNEELLEVPCDVLIPSALEDQITKENADRISARMVLELANGPVTPEADEILYKKDIVVVPDILANGGGVTVSTFEWEQNLKGEKWNEDVVREKLKEIMERGSRTVYEKGQSLQTDLRKASFIIALERLQEAMGYGGAK